ncbi:PadR family transcriptional regulator [Armatimonas rosea]|uniref:DNA-binding PadR family transcriptional regulator n=1 Tax=Armatimonas rosea TaxID=685828 RepID=A0A7W9SP31_ARMRO|nr:helix-turn-helix transcriptional regulator [Armatimonas rosea]MBB6050212.1 DNA-binding PadR family transcriptional regulator [Armatimonas rosea]
MAFRGDTEALILATLSGGPQHGYEITRRVNGLDGMKIQDGQLYPILHRLESEGMITAEWVPQEGKPARKVYRLTEAGGKKLEEKRTDWETFASSVSALLAKPEVRNA